MPKLKFWVTHLDQLDSVAPRWVRETVIADKVYVASSGVISFLDKPEAVKAEEEERQLLSIPSPIDQPLVPVRVITDLPKKRRNRFAGKKGSTAFEPIRVFAPGYWCDLEKAR